jgi:glycerate kinase
VLIPRHLLIATGPFPPALAAAEVAAAIARGVRSTGVPTPDLCPLEPAKHGPALREQLEELDFDTRMRRSRALIIATERLEEQTLGSSPTFELATRARQAGVPAYAVTATNALTRFDARILDLQLIIEATNPRALAKAGRKLADLA